MTSRRVGSPDGPATVVLAGSESRTSIAAARSLERAGVPFVVVSDDRGLVAASRRVRRHVVAPDPLSDLDAYASLIAELVDRTGAGVVVPLHDDALHVCSTRRAELAAAGATVAAAPPAAVDNVLDKRANLATAVALGIPTPLHFEIDDDGLVAGTVVPQFPLVVKRSSVRPSSNGVPAPFKWHIARDREELRVLLAQCANGPSAPLVEELLQGEIVGVYCFACRGQVVAMASSRALQRAGGQNVLREVVAVDAELAGYAAALLAKLRWEGPASLTFFVTADRGVRYLETNGRLWGVVEGLVHAGWDFPRWTVEYFRDGRVPRPGPISLGSKTVWRLGALHGLAAVAVGNAWLTDRQSVSGLRALAEYAATFRPGIHSDVFRLDDPLPELVEHWRWLEPAARRLGSRLLRRL